MAWGQAARLWYEEMGIAPQGPLLIEPMYAEKTAVGLLLVGGKRGGNWLVSRP
ncbi:MAG: hypothetical protein M5U34_39265 [Chloroflexi bacterium]|nr:hypothetical protein [Chloroflexota bacterium]